MKVHSLPCLDHEHIKSVTTKFPYYMINFNTIYQEYVQIKNSFNKLIAISYFSLSILPMTFSFRLKLFLFSHTESWNCIP